MATVCVLGGGYAGVRVARALRGRLNSRWTIQLVDRRPCHQLMTRLHEVVARKAEAADACIPFDRVLGRGIDHIQAEVTELDTKSCQVQTTAGQIRADWLVISLGSTADFLDIPGALQHSFTLKSVEDALQISQRLASLGRQRGVVRVVVVGAGYTGTEVAGELSALNLGSGASRLHGRVEVSLVAKDSQLLPQGNPRIGFLAADILRARGIPLILGVGVEGVSEESIALETGERIPADVVIWAAHTVASRVLVADQAWRGSDERLRVDPYLRLEAHERAFACGDCALAYDYARDEPAPASAQMAVQQGEAVAVNVAAAIEGRPLREYRPRLLGEALGLGGRDAVAEVGGIVFAGAAARAVKAAALARYMASLSLGIGS